VISRRTTVLLLLALVASVPFISLEWRRTLPCKVLQSTTLGNVYQQSLVRDEGGTGVTPCPQEDPTTISTAIIVLGWITFGSAAGASAMVDAAERLALLRRARMDDLLMKG